MFARHFPNWVAHAGRSNIAPYLGRTHRAVVDLNVLDLEPRVGCRRARDTSLQTLYLC
jgi:hypothetical protein